MKRFITTALIGTIVAIIGVTMFTGCDDPTETNGILIMDNKNSMSSTEPNFNLESEKKEEDLELKTEKANLEQAENTATRFVTEKENNALTTKDKETTKKENYKTTKKEEKKTTKKIETTTRQNNRTTTSNVQLTQTTKTTTSSWEAKMRELDLENTRHQNAIKDIESLYSKIINRLRQNIESLKSAYNISSVYSVSYCYSQINTLNNEIANLDRRIASLHSSSDAAERARCMAQLQQKEREREVYYKHISINDYMTELQINESEYNSRINKENKLHAENIAAIEARYSR